jgi:(2Fe-2S) ferredoxin
MDHAFRKHVFVCTNRNPEKPGRCGDKGSEEVLKALREAVLARGLLDVKVTPSGCINEHPNGPMVMVYPDGVWYAHVELKDVDEIVEAHLVQDRVVKRLFHKKVGP